MDEVDPLQASYKDAWNMGYWDGIRDEGKTNPFHEGGDLWKEYEDGYEEGWLDS